MSELIHVDTFPSDFLKLYKSPTVGQQHTKRPWIKSEQEPDIKPVIGPEINDAARFYELYHQLRVMVAPYPLGVGLPVSDEGRTVPLTSGKLYCFQMPTTSGRVGVDSGREEVDDYRVSLKIRTAPFCNPLSPDKFDAIRMTCDWINLNLNRPTNPSQTVFKFLEDGINRADLPNATSEIDFFDLYEGDMDCLEGVIRWLQGLKPRLIGSQHIEYWNAQRRFEKRVAAIKH